MTNSKLPLLVHRGDNYSNWGRQLRNNGCTTNGLSWEHVKVPVFNRNLELSGSELTRVHCIFPKSVLDGLQSGQMELNVNTQINCICYTPP